MQYNSIKWINRIKHDENNKTEIYKSWLVEGYSQTTGLNFNKTYTLVVRIKLVHVLLLWPPITACIFNTLTLKMTLQILQLTSSFILYNLKVSWTQDN